ncbi:hypothetical protein PILCRDRAFT_821539, partial [Piloderma croceum F 1598]
MTAVGMKSYYPHSRKAYRTVKATDSPPAPHSTKGPLDVVLMEGWCVGFSAISSHELEERWEERVGAEMKVWCAVEHVGEVNEMLKVYEALWAFSPDNFHFPFPKTLQEHYMKTHNGGMGMSDVQVVSFVDHYILGFFFLRRDHARFVHHHHPDPDQEHTSMDRQKPL